MKNLKIIVFILLLVANYNTVSAQQPGVVLSDKSGWHKIGETTANFSHEKDEILIVGASRFSQIKIKVTDAPVNIQSFDIHFDKGDVQNVTVGEQIKAPGETKVVQLDGKGERIIRKITFRYHTPGATTDKKAHIEVWGLKTNADKK